MAKHGRIYYDSCKDCRSRCEHSGENREFVYTDKRPSCKITEVGSEVIFVVRDGVV